MVGRSALGALGLALLLAGCGDEPPKAPVDTVPSGLHAVESAAEDAFDHALASDTTALGTDATRVPTLWKAFRAQALTDGAARVDVERLDAAVDAFVAAVQDPATDSLALARAANAMSEPMDELFAVYQPPTPATVLELDYLGREIELDGLVPDYPAATSDLATARDRWKMLEPTVTGKGGTSVASRFDAALDALSQAIPASDGTAVVAQAKHELDLVDEVEAVFMQPVDPGD